jgi:FAD/FMN-containing dehydrogenase
MRVVDAAGQPIKAGGAVVKNATGYGMTRLYIGSLGTLCVIAEASFKLMPQPEAEATILAAATSPQQALDVARAVNALAVRPAAIAAMRLAALPELARLMPSHEQRELLAIRLPGTEAAVRRAVAETEAALRQFGAQPLMTLDDASHEAFWASANDFPALRVGPREALTRINALPSEMGQALDMAEGLASEHGLRLLWLADLATGTLWLRLSAYDDAHDDEREGEALGRDVVFAASLRATLEALIRRWRLVTTLACPAPLKRTFALWGADSSGEDLMREVKRRFDPDHRLNPGRFVAGI